MSWSHYLLQVNIYLVVFFAFYKLLLAKETYFILNRVYLMCAGIFSLAIPFIQIDWFRQQPIGQQLHVQVDQLNQFFIETNAIADANPYLQWGTLVVLVYAVGVSFFILRFLVNLLAIKKMLNRAENGLAFSFWKRKNVPVNLPQVATVNHHEDVHVTQLHTLDVVFFELLGIIAWFNPIIYLYKTAIKNIHEYLADEAAANFQGDKETYSMLLLNQAFGINNNSLTNGFVKKSMIKKRIFMLYKERSKKTAIIKYGIFVPLFALALLLSSATIRKNEQILAAANQIPLNNVTKVVCETLQLPNEGTEVINIASTDVKFPLTKTMENGDGIQAFYRYLGGHIRYPVAALENQVQGNLVVTFKVQDKKTSDITVVTKLGQGADEEITKRIASYTNGDLKNGSYSLTVAFRLQGSTAPFLNPKAKNVAGHINLNTLSVNGYGIDPEEAINFISLDVPPAYPDGINEFYKFLAINLKYPEEAVKANIQGAVYVSFIVEKDGSITDIKIDRPLGYGTDEEAVRVLALSKKWTPGNLNGKPVRAKYSLPIKFSLNHKNESKAISPQPVTDKHIVLRGTDKEKLPLVYVDGQLIETESIKDIDPKTIDAISVLKDATSTAIYGDAAKNGVILINLKKTDKKEAPKN